MSVVICSLNGAAGADRCLRALATQTIRSSLQLIVVDDGSSDETSAVGRRHEATVIRHSTNLGLAAARNSGIAAATADVVAFLDDDCEPEPAWAEKLLTGFQEGVTGVGGPILPAAHDGFMLGYLKRNNPLKPQEITLAKSNRLDYRLSLYLRRQWTPEKESSHREVYSFAGANMSFTRKSLVEVGQFDERFRFGGEDLDLCMRMRLSLPGSRLVFVPDAKVAHHFNPSLSDALRRSRAYGRGSARLYRKWPAMPPTFFPGPLLVLALLVLSKRRRALALAAIAAPHLLYPRGMRHTISSRSGASLSDAYIQLAQEAYGNIGFLEGLWIFRHLIPEAGTRSPRAVIPRETAGLAP